ncbi:MAG: alkaline phosphatase family protein, partial [Chloroflexota bacterium]
ALHRLQAWIAEDKNLIWRNLLTDGLLAPLTSIAPSTTSAAITTYWTGTPPTQHGVAGYEQWLREYSLIANMIEHKPITYTGGTGNMTMAGFEPETFLPVPTFGTHLKENGVASHSFQHFSLAHSGLSRTFMKGTSVHPFSTQADLFISLRQFLETTTDERLYTWVYWSAVDSLSHFHGPNHQKPKADFSHFSMAFEHFFLNQLDRSAHQDTLVILTADHGQITTNNLEEHYNLNNHPNLLRRLHMLPTGENRKPFLYVKPGQIEAVKETITNTWPNQFTVLDSDYALHQGLFGPGVPY